MPQKIIAKLRLDFGVVPTKLQVIFGAVEDWIIEGG
jgi:hypothetical protein